MSNIELLQTMRRRNTEGVDYKGMLNIVEGQLATADEELAACIEALKYLRQNPDNSECIEELPEHIKKRLK